MDQNESLFRNSIDALRTAPFALGAAAAEGSLGCVSYFYFESLIMTGAAALGVGVAALAVSKQFRLRRRLERSIARSGYRDEIFATTTDAWCGRQTARVVTGRSGHLEEYTALCERTREQNALMSLPHI